MSDQEIAERGYDTAHVKKAAIFPKDGNFPPYLDEEFENFIQENGGMWFSTNRKNVIQIQILWHVIWISWMGFLIMNHILSTFTTN